MFNVVVISYDQDKLIFSQSKENRALKINNGYVALLANHSNGKRYNKVNVNIRDQPTNQSVNPLRV